MGAIVCASRDAMHRVSTFRLYISSLHFVSAFHLYRLKTLFALSLFDSIISNPARLNKTLIFIKKRNQIFCI